MRFSTALLRCTLLAFEEAWCTKPVLPPTKAHACRSVTYVQRCTLHMEHLMVGNCRLQSYVAFNKSGNVCQCTRGSMMSMSHHCHLIEGLLLSFKTPLPSDLQMRTT